MKKLLVLLLALVLVISFIGCKKSGDTTTGTTKEASQAGTPKKGGTVKIYITSEPATLLAWEIRNPTDVMVGTVVNEYLFMFDETGTPQPHLVESYEADPKALTYTLKLRKGIKFHDGSNLNAEAVAWNLNFYKANGVLTGSFYGLMEEAKAVDDSTVVVKMSQWDSLFPVALARTCPITSKEAYDKHGKEYLASNPVGTGPFKFSKWDHDVKVSLTRFDDYWQGKPYLDGLDFVIYSEPLVAATALQAGEIDVLPLSNFDIATDLAKKDGIVLKTGVLTGTGFTLCFMANNPDDPFHDIRVRQAVAYAIDTKVIAETVTKGFYFDSNQWCAKDSPYYSDKVTGHPYNIEKAKQLLADAGYPNGFSTRITGEIGQLEDGAQIIAEQLSKIGIKVELNYVERANYASYIGGWEYGMLLHPMGTTNGQASQLVANFKQGLNAGLGVKAFPIPDDLHNLVLQSIAAPVEEADPLFREIAYKVFEENLFCKVVVLTKQVIAHSNKLKADEIWLRDNYTHWHTAWLDK